MSNPSVAILHYSCYPVIGGVEVIIEAHARLFADHDYPVKLIVGEGEPFHSHIPVKVIPEMRSLHRVDPQLNRELEEGRISQKFETLRDSIYEKLKEELSGVDIFIPHNILTMHFNLPLTAALSKIIKDFSTRDAKCISWCHDATFKDPHYASQWREKYPWHLLSSALPKVNYVAISQMRRRQLSQLFKVKQDRINVIPDGIDPKSFLNLSPVSLSLFDHFRLFEEDLVMFYPTRIVRRKNIELAIQITKSINEKGHRASLLVTSPPDPHNEDSIRYYQSLKQLAGELDMEKKIIFLCEYEYEEGKKIRVDDHLLRDLYLLSDLLLFTTRGEGFGIPILESAVAHLPVVCSRIEPLTEVAGEEVLYLDLDDKPQKMAEAIIGHMSSHKSLSLFKRVMRNYTWGAIFTQKIKPLIKSTNQQSQRVAK